jgi:hypothetical protein
MADDPTSEEQELMRRARQMTDDFGWHLVGVRGAGWEVRNDADEILCGPATLQGVITWLGQQSADDLP